MLNLLFFIIIIVLFIVIGGLFSIFGFITSIFRGTKKETEPDTFKKSSSGNKKIFTPNEGEYVDFEEVKDDK